MDAERLAILEQRAEEATRQREHIFDRLEAQDEDLRAIRDDVHEIRRTISGHMGFLKGVLFVFTAIGGIVGASVAAFWNRIFGSN